MRRNGLFTVMLVVFLVFNGYLYAEEFPLQSIWNTDNNERKTKDMGKPQEPGGGILLSGDCSDYTDLTGQPLPIIKGGTTVGAANNYGPFGSMPLCWEGIWWNASGSARDVTYKWTVPTDGRYTISLCGSSYDCVLLLYNFTCPAEPVYPDDFICGNDDYCGNRSELNGYWFAGGQELLIVIDGFGNNSGSYVLQISAYHAAPIDSVIVESMRTYHIPGLAACVVNENGMVWSGAYGYANIDQNIEVADTTLFKVASISKTFTGTALMQLYENGLFDMNDDINNYLPPELQVHNPNYPGDSITFYMLLTHTSSIRDEWDNILHPLTTWGADSPIPLDTFLVNYLIPGGYYYNQATNFYNTPPGVDWEYCNVAFTLMGYLVETMADSFPLYCQDSIFAPLNMYETAWFLRDLDTNNIAMPYSWNGSSYVPYGHYGNPIYPAGLLRTSSFQLANFLTAYINHGQFGSGSILDSVTVQQITTAQPGIGPPNTIMCGQGLTWIDISLHGRQLWGHDGAWHGITTYMGYEKDENWGYIIMFNSRIGVNEFIFLSTELMEFAAGWPYGSIAGTVIDEFMNPIEGVLVETVGPGTSDHTDASGEYILQYLSPGTYEISVSHPDYYDYIISDVIVTADIITIQDIQMIGVCDYIVGDVNGSDSYNGLDITYGVSCVKGTGPDPACSECFLCPDWHYCGDVNASCNYNGLDITYGVNYFKFGSPAPLPCPDCPPE